MALIITHNIKRDKSIQLIAFMPNFVYLSDATYLTMLYDSYFKAINGSGSNIVNFYSVHDCYGVTAKCVETLLQTLRTVYINIYSVNTYIKKFNQDIIYNIIASRGKVICKFYK